MKYVMYGYIYIYEYMLCFHSLADCKTNPCKNSGKCIVKDNDIECNCAPNYSGEFCENGE